eukprot:GFYU01014848.1.p1 GENE.GFYU01014848.1~~GFYU01014848.1.p1  ORF type:complete len:464 (-),score=100.43 GFYU01014848.1:111-1502(-)
MSSIASPLQREQLTQWATDQRASYEGHLKTLVEFATVSSEPDVGETMKQCAAAAKALLESFGATAWIQETKGWPVILGQLEGKPEMPTVTFYNHLDVVPATEPEWKDSPFVFQRDGDTYKGRGTTDDKGPLLSCLYGIHAAKLAGAGLNVKFIWEMEEEIGSPNLMEALTKNKDKMKTDMIAISDTIWLTRGKPSTPIGLRGQIGFSFSLETAPHDLHSGLVGGAARNPLSELTTLAANMFDGNTGEVKIPGFYDAALQLEEEEKQEFMDSAFSVETFKKDHQLSTLRTEDKLELMTNVWARPTMEVIGLVGGWSGPKVKAVVPPRAEIKMGCRIVPNMTCQGTLDMIEQFAKAQNPDVKFEVHSQLEPYKGSLSGPYPQAIRNAYSFGFGSKPSFIREGGSIGAIAVMREALDKPPVYFLGLSLPSHRYHGPNETYDWEQAEGGIAMFAHFVLELSNGTISV